MSRAEALYRLQLLDLDLDKAVRRAREIDAAIKENPAVTRVKNEISAIEGVVSRAAGEHRSIEMDAQIMDEKIGSEEKRLYGGTIKSSKEMVDTQHEVDSLKKHRATIEEKMLEAMMALDEARATERRVQAVLKQSEGKWAEDTVALKKEMADLRTRYAGLTEQRAGLISAIAKPDLDAYAALRAKKPNGVAVSLIRSGSCGTCGEEASSMHIQQARTGTTLVICSSCGRILHG